MVEHESDTELRKHHGFTREASFTYTVVFCRLLFGVLVKALDDRTDWDGTDYTILVALQLGFYFAITNSVLHYFGMITTFVFKVSVILSWSIEICLGLYVSLNRELALSGMATAIGTTVAVSLSAAGTFGPSFGVLQYCVHVIVISLMYHIWGTGESEPLVLVDVITPFIVSTCIMMSYLWFNERVRGSLQAKIHIQRMAKKAELAESESKYKTEFLGRMTHELKTPLSVLTSATEHLLRTELPRDYAHWHQVQYESCGLLRSLLDNVLSLHRIETDQQYLLKEPFHFRSIVEEARQMLAVSAQLKKIQFSVSVSPLLADSHVGDAVRARQIIMNLASNAIRFTDKGSVKIYIDVVYQNKFSQTLHVRVVDTGVGMSVEQQRAILAQTSVVPSRGGSGIGLKIVQRIVRLMSGNLWVLCDGVDRGCIFIAEITLPTIDTPMNPIVVEGESFDDQEPRNVLLVEDNVHIQSLVTLHLESAGHTVTVADNGQQGFDLFVRSRVKESDRFDIILMDILMPVMNGLECTKMIREIDPTIPVIAMTAHSMKHELLECLEAGASGYLGKPVCMADLVEVVDTLGDSAMQILENDEEVGRFVGKVH